MLYMFVGSGGYLICLPKIPKNIKYYTTISNNFKTVIFGNSWSRKISTLSQELKTYPEIRTFLDKYKNIKSEDFNKFIEIENNKNEPEFVETRLLCDNCGILLNDSGTCPICDDGEEDYY